MNTIRHLLAVLLLALAMAGNAIAAEKVNINTADAATLERVLVNVGASKAEAIVAHRKSNGPFRSAEQLAELHHRSHAECFIASSVKTDVRCEPVA